ncbi:hypothetical protein PIIN_03074 [Serendipita indica DSM 11827]|uniref:Uncharacterized protein n=1 Tax=Serendipita indica (strain DSM 11827) TaxID=1109443 RepID=G4TCX2_SERID|nr:hypothetical protein PIIN_03074 [Serendipita indica DSM 11827]
MRAFTLVALLSSALVALAAPVPAPDVPNATEPAPVADVTANMACGVGAGSFNVGIGCAGWKKN